MDITIPYNYTPRNYQLPLLRAMDSRRDPLTQIVTPGKKRACWVVHRRGGKDKTALNYTVKKMFERKGTYYHCFPEYSQGRKIIWDGIDGQGTKFTDHFPKKLVKRSNNQEMKIEMKNGSIWQVVGADNYDSVVGSNPVGIVFSEWAVSDKYPLAWDYFRPMLVENGGWAIFIYTPRGRNHGFTLYQMAVNNPEWFCELLTVDQTNALSREDIESERRAGMSDAMIQQEFYCSFLASTEDIVIPFDLIQAATMRDVAYPLSPLIAGLDVARYGNDRTALVVRQGGVIVHIEVWRDLDIAQTTGKVIDRWNRKFFDAIAVDVIGIGAGVKDNLKAAGVKVKGVNVAEVPRSNRFVRLRDELWWMCREWFESRECGFSNVLNERDKASLIADIQDIHYAYSPVGKIKIEDKYEMKKRLGFSPDLGDALCLTFTPFYDLDYPEAKRKATKQVSFSNWQNRNAPASQGGYVEIRA